MKNNELDKLILMIKDHKTLSPIEKIGLIDQIIQFINEDNKNNKKLWDDFQFRTK